jgi:hypothetical protein
MIPSVKTILKRLEELLRQQDAHHPIIAAKIIRRFMQDATGPKMIDVALDGINDVLQGYGVEGIPDAGWHNYYCSTGLLYVNMGDTYTPTVIYDTRKSRWIIGSLGDLVERNEKRFGGA